VLSILLIVLIIAVALFLLAVISGLVVWAASGMGWVLINWLHLPFTSFEATLLSLITFVAVAWSAWRLVVNLVTLPLGPSRPEDKDEDADEEDWDEDEDDYEEEEPEEAQPIPSIPKWRQPIRRASDGLPIVDPDDRCPCGSGRKYKNCHGRKK
jgi:hypothetical protein